MKARSGPKSLFRGKLTMPISVTLTPQHHAQILHAARRVGLSRSDTIALLIDRFADVVEHEVFVALPRPALPASGLSPQQP